MTNVNKNEIRRLIVEGFDKTIEFAVKDSEAYIYNVTEVEAINWDRDNGKCLESEIVQHIRQLDESDVWIAFFSDFH